MNTIGKLEKYTVFEINDILEQLRPRYDVVRLVDTEECRILDVEGDGRIGIGQNCFAIWGRSNRCANCSSFRACQTHHCTDKVEHLGSEREKVHSIPVYLEMANGEMTLCVIECVQSDGREADSWQEWDPDEYIVSHDVLTRLYSRERLFREIRLHLMEEPETRWLLLMWNIRNFTLINRLFGVEDGNRLLTGIADILRRDLGGKALYGRYRDDRFLVLIKKESFDEALFLRGMREAGDLIGSPIFRIQSKLGVYEIPGSGMPASKMIEHADIAADSIRDARDQQIAWYEPGMLKRKMKDQRIISDFEQALHDGEFDIYLQPQVTEDGTVLGGEALVRWMRPDGTIRLPGEFLDVLHQSELLSHLDEYVWEKAVRLLSEWKDTDLGDLYVSVNVDPTDFYYLDVPGVLARLCAKYGVSPEKLRVEITETALVEDAERQGGLVDRLHEAGFLVEIDDFGKGFSSLSLLKDIHADVLKIDMGFVRNSVNRQRSEIILKSVIDMAQRLHMGVITEGVETPEQIKMLTDLGCRDFQGFYYSRPVPVEDFETVVLGQAG